MQEKIKAYPIKGKMVNFPVENLLEEELKNLMLIDAKRIDHTEVGSKDLADAICAVNYHCVRSERPVDGAFSWRTLKG
jgi:hypothetical protein